MPSSPRCADGASAPLPAARRKARGLPTDIEDWLFCVLLPFAAYATLVGTSYAARLNVGGALFGVGGASLLLLFIGIQNAWDAVTYHVFVNKRAQEEDERRS